MTSRFFSSSLNISTHGFHPAEKTNELVTLVPATSPMNSNQFEFLVLVAGTKFWSLRLDFMAKMASSHDVTSPCDLLEGLVAGTSRIVCADLKLRFFRALQTSRVLHNSIVHAKA